MDYIRTEADGQLTLTQSTEFLFIPSCLYGFHNTETTVEKSVKAVMKQSMIPSYRRTGYYLPLI